MLVWRMARAAATITTTAATTILKLSTAIGKLKLKLITRCIHFAVIAVAVLVGAGKTPVRRYAHAQLRY